MVPQQHILGYTRLTAQWNIVVDGVVDSASRVRRAARVCNFKNHFCDGCGFPCNGTSQAEEGYTLYKTGFLKYLPQYRLIIPGEVNFFMK